MKCKKCNKEISSPFCPYCGEKAKPEKLFYKKWWIWAILGVTSFLFLFCVSGVALDNDSAVSVEEDAESIPTISPSASPSATPSPSPSAKPLASPSALPSATPSALPSPSPSASSSGVSSEEFDKSENAVVEEDTKVELKPSNKPKPSKIVTQSPTPEAKPSATLKPSASKDSTGDSSSKGNGTQVYITENGKRYHCNPDCSNMKSPEAVTIDQAKAKGKTACKTCY